MHSTIIDVATLQHSLKDPQWVVVDCRFDLANPKAGRAAYIEAHIPGARYADLNKDLSAPVTSNSGRHPLPSPDIFAAKLGQWGIERQSQVVAYDTASGAFAARLWWLLRWLGHESVAVLEGGWQAWQAAGLPQDHSTPVMVPRQFVPRVRQDLALTVEAIQQGLAAHAIQLIDARGPARYAGDVEPIDPVAGHIPGAINLPYEGNLDSQGHFLPAEQLRARFAPMASAASANRVIHMCGSGVTACHNLLAMEIAGLRGSRLYPGSWSEWIRDPGRNVKKGHEA